MTTTEEKDDFPDRTNSDLRDVREVDEKALGHLGEHSGLKRTVGFKSVIGMNLASMLGSCLLLPGIANSLTGSSAWLSIIVSGIAVLPACISKGELSTAMPYSGGDYIYLARAFGPMLGAITGIGVWFDLLFQAIFGLRGSTEYIKILIGDVSEAWLKVIGVVLLLAVLCLNLSGMKWVKVVTKWYTLFIMLFLLSVALACFGSDDSSNYHYENNFMTEGIVGFFQTAAFVHMGYGGLTKICALASEVKNPGFNLPYGMLISLGIMVAWFATVTAVMASIKDDIDKTDYSPFYTMGDSAAGDVMGKFCALLCVVGMASMGNVSLLAVARFPFAMARDGLVPLQFEAIWHRTGAPWFSLVFCSVAVGFAIVTLPIKRIVKLASAFKILIFMACNVALIVFRVRKTEWYNPEFLSPMYPLIQIIGILFGIVMLALMDIEGLFATIAIIIMGLIAYMAYGKKHAKFMGVLKPEEYFNIVPLAYLEHEKNKAIERELSVSDKQALVATMIHDPGFLADWRTWAHEEILFWFVHINEGRYAQYSSTLGSNIPKYLKSGKDLKHINDLTLRILGVDDALHRRQIVEDLQELEMIENTEEIWGYGAADMDAMIEKDKLTGQNKGWLSRFAAGEANWQDDMDLKRNPKKSWSTLSIVANSPATKTF